MSRYAEPKQCRALSALPSSLWGGVGGGGGAIDAPALRPALPPSPPLPQPAAGLPASDKFKSAQTPAGRGLGGGGTRPGFPLALITFRSGPPPCSPAKCSSTKPRPTSL